MNKKTIGLTSALAVTLALIASVGFMSLQDDMNQQKYNPGLIPHPVSIKKLTGGEKVSDVSEVKRLTGYDVKLPTKLPQGYDVQLLIVNTDSKTTTILISKESATEDTLNTDFIWRDEGIMVTIKELRSDIHTKERLAEMLSPFPSEPVKIKEFDGVAHEIITQTFEDETTHAPAELAFYEGNKYIYMQGMVAVTDLISVAETL